MTDLEGGKRNGYSPSWEEPSSSTKSASPKAPKLYAEAEATLGRCEARQPDWLCCETCPECDEVEPGGGGGGAAAMFPWAL